MKRLPLLLFAILLFSTTFAQKDFRNTKLSIEERTQILLQQLTLDEKIAMLEHNNPAIERLGIPAYSWWNEALHGVARNGFATVYPMPIALAATFDAPAVEEMFSMVGDEARIKYFEALKAGRHEDNTGITFFAPNINIFRDPRWGRGMETFGEDPHLTAVMGAACVNGLQQKINDRYKALACIKHFAVHSGPEADRHSFDAVVNQRALWTTYLPAFKHIVTNTDVSMVMCGYNRLNGTPCCTNDDLLVRILRDSWGYDGLFVTDCWALNDCWERDTVIPRHETHESAAAAAVDAFGSVIDLECGSGLNALKDAVKSGLISEDIIDYHAFRVLKAKFELGMFDPEQPFTNITKNSANFDSKALEISQKSIVLLKNDNKILPLDAKRYKNIAIIGPNACDSVMLSGNYNGTPRHTVTIYEGIMNYIESLPKNSRPNIYFDTACHHVDGKYRIPADFDRQIAKSDLVIFVGGLSPELEGEQLDVEVDGFHGGDRTNIDLPRIQEGMMRKIKNLGKPLVFVLCSGGAVALDWEDENADAILEAWYGGQSAGTAVANILFGKTNPSGKLPVTFYSTNNYIPPFESYEMEHRTYRFMTEKPLYPFGFGLSYSDFEYSEGIFDFEKQALIFDITNTSNIDGEEVAMVYVTNKQDDKSPVKTLAAFCRVKIPAKQTRKVELKIDDEFFMTFIDEYNHFERIPGNFELHFGNRTMQIKM